jgi:hypothetical protein
MMSPFFGLSIITHLAICFIYETAALIHGLILGFPKDKSNDELPVLFRDKDEKILPAVIIGTVFGSLVFIASLSIHTSLQSHPNNLEGILSTANVVQAAVERQNEKPEIPAPYPLTEGNYQFYSFSR